MRATLSILDAAGPRVAELPKARASLGSGPTDSIHFRADTGVRPAHAVLSWEPRRATWTLTRTPAAPDAPLAVNGRPLPLGATGAAAVVALNHLDTIELPGVFLRFSRVLDPPLFRGQPVGELPLDGASVVLGRRESSPQSSPTPPVVPPGGGGTPAAELKLDLDAEDGGISKVHAVIARGEGGNYYLDDRSKLGTELNGKSFTRALLVYGDRFRIRDYIFEFTGGAIRRVDQGDLGHVSARHVTVEIHKKDFHRRILDDLSVDIRAGEFVGILGGSGQGKSTLLNALCGINPATSGEVLISGVPLTSREQVNAAGVGFVPQDDIVHRELTVTEAVTFSARLRLRLPPAQIRALVDRAIERLGLAEHRDKRIDRLSGGQRKRVSVAIELLARPSVLFLDEPSSGLDPATESDLMTLLQSLRLTNLTVVCTTHVLQKAYLFDRLVFIHGGRLIFIGTADEARQHFLLRGANEAGGGNLGETATTASFDRSPLEKIYSLLADPTKSAEEWEREFHASPVYQRLASSGNNGAGPVVATPPAPTPPVAPAAPPRRARVGYLATLGLLFARQWKILLADPLNLLFLLAQPLAIGFLVGWVAESAGLRAFLCVVSTLWFGCSNGAQRIVSEVPIFRRERVCGLGLNPYLQSKLLFLSLLTAVQAVVLFFTVFTSAHLFQKSEFDRKDFAAKLEERILGAPIAAAAQDAADEQERQDFDVVGADEPKSKPPAAATPKPAVAKPTPPRRPGALTVGTVSALANYFYLKDNILDSGAKTVTKEDGSPVRGADGKPVVIPGPSVWNIVFTTLGLKALGLLAAAVVGVSLGLTISALVQTDTQAVMWVPLILIPQILFGGFVVTVPEMSRSVRAFSHLVPSFSAQRVMDVSNLYGQATPFLTNRTKTPLFLTSDGRKETLEWNENGRHRTQDYDKLSLFNTSWQNLVVWPDHVGEHKHAGTRAEGGLKVEYRDTVETRNDVRYTKGQLFRFLAPAQVALGTLFLWTLGCYGVTLLGLRGKQTGK